MINFAKAKRNQNISVRQHRNEKQKIKFCCNNDKIKMLILIVNNTNGDIIIIIIIIASFKVSDSSILI